MPPFSHAPAPTTTSPPSQPTSGDPLLDEAMALQELLRGALARVSQLVALLKNEKRQRRLLSTALGSLQKLRPWPPSS